MRRVVTWGLASVLGAIGVTLVVAPYILGHQMRTAYEESLAAGSKPGQWDLSLRHYDQGWFSSEAVVTVRFSGPYAEAYRQYRQDADLPPKPLEMQTLHYIDHGPFGRGEEGVKLAAATIRGVVKSGPDAQPWVKADSLVHLDGATVTQVHAPAAERSRDRQQTTSMSWEGLDGTIRLGPEQKSARVDIRVPGVALGGRQHDIAAGPLVWQGDYQRTDDAFWLGETVLQLARLSVKQTATEHVDLQLRELALEGRQQAQGEDLTASLDLRFESGQLNDRAFGPGVWHTELRHLDRRAVAHVQQQLEAARSQGLSQEGVQTAAAQALVKVVPELVASDPELELSPLRLDTPEGRLQGRLLIGLQGVDSGLKAGLPALLQHLRVKVDLAVPEPLTHRWLTRAMEQSLASQAELAELPANERALQAETMAEAQLTQLQAQGLVNHQAGRYTSQIRLRQGQVTINNQPGPPLAQLLGQAEQAF